MQAQASVTGRPPIPAMTTDAERECYYRLAKEAAGKGEIIELGAWLGASTAYIAAGIRDAGSGTKVHVYDGFQSKPAHGKKVKAFYDRENLDPIPIGDARRAFEGYVGPLMAHVVAHQGRIEDIVSSAGPIALLVSDAPKRVREISGVLTALHKHIVAGTVMAWQDFCHFPSYEIPACLYRLRAHLVFVEAVVPGTTLVFRIASPFGAEEVSRDALTLKRWSPREIDAAWSYWLPMVREEKRGLFACGKAMFLCDIGQPALAVNALAAASADRADDVLSKWRYLAESRGNLVERYRPLFDHLASVGAL